MGESDNIDCLQKHSGTTRRECSWLVLWRAAGAIVFSRQKLFTPPNIFTSLHLRPKVHRWEQHDQPPINESGFGRWPMRWDAEVSSGVDLAAPLDSQTLEELSDADTGRKSLFISPGYVRGVDGMSDAAPRR